MRVFLVDSQPIFREGLKTIIGTDQNLRVVGEADTYRDVLQTAQNTDLLIVDGELDSLPFLNSLQKTRSKGRRPFVLVLTKHTEEEHAVQMITAGADGYLYKSDAPGTVLDAIRRIIEGRKYVPSHLAETMIFSMNGGTNGVSRLSPREYEVLYLYASGMGMKQIAAHLCLSVKTVSTYRSRLLDKLHLQSNAELMRYACKKGIAD
jgi:DNA-binding NarL/FixJ family response regulator